MPDAKVFFKPTHRSICVLDDELRPPDCETGPRREARVEWLCAAWPMSGLLSVKDIQRGRKGSHPHRHQCGSPEVHPTCTYHGDFRRHRNGGKQRAVSRGSAGSRMRGLWTGRRACEGQSGASGALQTAHSHDSDVIFQSLEYIIASIRAPDDVYDRHRRELEPFGTMSNPIDVDGYISSIREPRLRVAARSHSPLPRPDPPSVSSLPSAGEDITMADIAPPVVEGAPLEPAATVQAPQILPPSNPRFDPDLPLSPLTTPPTSRSPSPVGLPPPRARPSHLRPIAPLIPRDDDSTETAAALGKRRRGETPDDDSQNGDGDSEDDEDDMPLDDGDSDSRYDGEDMDGTSSDADAPEPGKKRKRGRPRKGEGRRDVEAGTGASKQKRRSDRGGKPADKVPLRLAIGETKGSGDSVVALFNGIGDESVYSDVYEEQIRSILDICRGGSVASIRLGLSGDVTIASICAHMDSAATASHQMTFIHYMDRLRLALLVEA